MYEVSTIYCSWVIVLATVCLQSNRLTELQHNEIMKYDLFGYVI